MFQNPFADPMGMSLSDIQKRQKIAQGLIGNMGNAPNIGTGVAQLAQGITMGIMRPKLEEAEKAKQAAANLPNQGVMSAFGNQPEQAQTHPNALFGFGQNNRGLIDFSKIFGGK